MVLLSSLSFCPEAEAGGGAGCAPRGGQRGWEALMHSELHSSRLTSMIEVFFCHPAAVEPEMSLKKSKGLIKLMNKPTH